MMSIFWATASAVPLYQFSLFNCCDAGCLSLLHLTGRGCRSVQITGCRALLPSRCDSLSIGHSSLVLKAVQDVVSISKNSVESGGSVSETECTSPDDAICALSKAPMLRGVGQVPIKAVVVVPFGALGKLTAHKQQFLARMPPHVAVICP